MLLRTIGLVVILVFSCWGLPASAAPTGATPATAAPGTAATAPAPGAAAKSPTAPPVVVIGFAGGFVRHDDMAHGPVQLGARLSHELPAGAYVQVFENRHGAQAHTEVLRRLSSPEEKLHARVIIYGHSWGAT